MNEASNIIQPNFQVLDMNKYWEEQTSPAGENETVDLGHDEIRNGLFLYTIRPTKGIIQLKNISYSAIREALRRFRIMRRRISPNVFTYVIDQDSRLTETDIPSIARRIQTQIETSGDVSFSWKGLECSYTVGQLLEVFGKMQSQIFTKTNIDIWLDEDERALLDSEPGTTRMLFSNGVAEITTNGIEMFPYSNYHNYAIWKEDIKPHLFRPVSENEAEQCDFARFLNNVAGENIQQFRSAIGYLLSGYKRPTDTQTVILNDAEANDPNTPMGGSGKGIFSKAIQTAINTAVIDGKQFDPSDKFRWQRVTPQTKVINIDDLKKGIPFETFHSVSSEGLDIEKKFCGVVRMTEEQAPKLLISSNSVFTELGTTNTRRQFILEFSNYYSSQTAKGIADPVIDEFGRIFFSREWDKAEWDKFYSYMFYCVSLFQRKGLIQPKQSTVKDNRLFAIAGEGFSDFITEAVIIGEEYGCSYLCKQFNDSPLKDTNSPVSVRTFKRWLKLYADTKGLAYSERNTNGAQLFRLIPNKV